MTHKTTWVALASVFVVGCDKGAPTKQGEPKVVAGSAAPAAPPCTTIEPANYCIVIPPGYERRDSMMVDHVLREKGGDNNFWHPPLQNKSVLETTLISIKYRPDVAAYADYKKVLEVEAARAESWKALPTVENLPSGEGRYFRATEAAGTILSRSIVKGSKYFVECTVRSPAAAIDNAAHDACKTITMK